jgi:hypothetical protein
MEEEEWRPVQDYPDYQVSNLGRVKSAKVWRGVAGRILAPGRSSRGGYLVVSLSNENGMKTFTTYRLVAVAFIPNPDGKPEVDHINNNRTDNRVSNLRWSTRSENNHNVGVKKTNVLGFKGVSIMPGRNKKYKAQIRHNGHIIRLGYFHTPEEAHAVYIAKARELHGEFFTQSERQEV